MNDENMWEDIYERLEDGIFKVMVQDVLLESEDAKVCTAWILESLIKPEVMSGVENLYCVMQGDNLSAQVVERCVKYSEAIKTVSENEEYYILPYYEYLKRKTMSEEVGLNE